MPLRLRNTGRSGVAREFVQTHVYSVRIIVIVAFILAVGTAWKNNTTSYSLAEEQ